MSWFPALQAEGMYRKVFNSGSGMRDGEVQLKQLFGNVEREVGVTEVCRVCNRRTVRRSTGLWRSICTEGLCTGETYAGTRYHTTVTPTRCTDHMLSAASRS